MLLPPIFIYSLVGLILLGAIYLSIRSNILRNPSNEPNRKFSLARTQMMWWTLIVASCFVIHYGQTSDYNIINNSTLILLGIAMVTTAGANTIDISQQENNKLKRHQDTASKGFFIDILSDGSGVSIHRFQAVLFTLIFGITFVATFLNKGSFPEFNSAELMLMGISSGTYMLLKINENKLIASTDKTITTKAIT